MGAQKAPNSHTPILHRAPVVPRAPRIRRWNIAVLEFSVAECFRRFMTYNLLYWIPLLALSGYVGFSFFFPPPICYFFLFEGNVMDNVRAIWFDNFVGVICGRLVTSVGNASSNRNEWFIRQSLVHIDFFFLFVVDVLITNRKKLFVHLFLEGWWI